MIPPPRGLALLALLAGACSSPENICDDSPPKASEFRATCTKNGRPEDCAEAMDLCRSAAERPSDYCLEVCNDDPARAPKMARCTVSVPGCTAAIVFVHVECTFCPGL